jgi:hypothetical protein
MNNNIIPTFAAVTTWIDTNEAKAKRAELIASGLNKSQVKLSSYRWADMKDHSKGYMCRVMVIKGLRPELECGDAKPRVKKENTANFVTELNTGNSEHGETKNCYYRRNEVHETMTA